MSNIPHYLRLKPKNALEKIESEESIIEEQDDTQIRFQGMNDPAKFTKIFNDISQLDLYQGTLQDLTLKLFEGVDGVFFTLGPSNSGKSYSVYGDDSNPGLVLYSLNEILNKIKDKLADYKVFKKHFGETLLVGSSVTRGSTGEYGVSISVFEIYNDRIRDLTLDSYKTINQSLDIVSDIRDGKTKPNKIRQIYITNLEEAKLVLHKSIKRRAVSATNLNQKSSRSHLFIYLNLHQVLGNIIKTSRLTIADLAGSERTKTARTEGKEFREGNYTNTSLTELGRCLTLMKSKKFERSTLRTNKLTRLLLTDLFNGDINQNRIKILLTLDPFSTLSTILHAIRYIQPVSKATIKSERGSLNSFESYQLSQLNEEVKLLKTVNNKLQADIGAFDEKSLNAEIQLRQEICGEYENRIQELEAKHVMEINELKDTHQKSTDSKLSILANDYEKQLKDLESSHELKIKELEQAQTMEIAKVHEESEQIPDQIVELQNLKKELESLREDLKEKRDVESKLEQTLKELKHSQKKEKKSSQKIEQLTDKLNKREDEVLTKTNKKRKPNTSPEKSSKKNKAADFKEDELLSLSPIKFEIYSSKDNYSPNKQSPKKSISKISDTHSPSKRKVLEESQNFLNTALDSAIKTRSPSKGKKKLRQHKIFNEDDSFL